MKPGRYKVDYSQVRSGEVTVNVMQEDIDASEDMRGAVERAISEEGIDAHDLDVMEWEVHDFKPA